MDITAAEPKLSNTMFSRRTIIASAFASVVAGCASAPSLRAAQTLKLKQIVANSPTIDVHTHLVPPAWFGVTPKPAPKYTPDQLASQIARNPYIPVPDPSGIVARNYDRLMSFEGARFDGTIEASAAVLIAEMDAAGIDISVNNCMDEIGEPFRRKYAVPIERTLEDIARMAVAYPGRLVNFFGVDPRRGVDGLALMRRAVSEYGCCGMGEWLTDQWQVMPNDRAVAYPFLALCEEMQIPYGNNGSGLKPSQTPEVFEQILRDFPKLKVVHQAAGLLTDDERAADPDKAGLPYHLLELAERHDNFWLDIDDWQRLDDEGKLRLFRFLRRAFDGPAAGRVMFGSDFPVFTRPISAADYVQSIINDGARLGVELTNAEITHLFSTNALRMLNGPHAPSFLQDAAARHL